MVLSQAAIKAVSPQTASEEPKESPSATSEPVSSASWTITGAAGLAESSGVVDTEEPMPEAASGKLRGDDRCGSPLPRPPPDAEPAAGDTVTVNPITRSGATRTTRTTRLIDPPLPGPSRGAPGRASPCFVLGYQSACHSDDAPPGSDCVRVPARGQTRQPGSEPSGNFRCQLRRGRGERTARAVDRLVSTSYKGCGGRRRPASGFTCADHRLRPSHKGGNR